MHVTRRRLLVASLGALAPAASAQQATAQPAAEPAQQRAAGDALSRYIEGSREAAAAAEPPAEREQRQRERAALLLQGEAALSSGEVAAALAAFERAALMLHAADTEMALVRAYMQAGEYRRAVSFSAHTAGAHRQVVAGAVLYAWLLWLGGQETIARRLLDSASEAAPPDPLLREARALLDAPFDLPRGALLAPPWRLAPYSVGAAIPRGAQVVSSALLVDRGRRALAPLASLAGSRSLWLRNGLGATTRASIERRLLHLGVAALRLDPALPQMAPTKSVERDPFPGSPGYAVEYLRSADAGPAWPRLHLGFHGAADGENGLRRLGIQMPPGARGGLVFDAGGHVAGIAMPHADGHDRVLMATQLRQELGSMFEAPIASAPRRAPLDEVYENSLGIALQVIAVS